MIYITALLLCEKGGFTLPEGRDKAGRFTKGHSGNPTGKPTQENAEIKEILKAASVRAAERLVELIDSKQEKIALQAVKEILDRTQGKPRDNVQMNLSGSLDFRSQVRDILMERLYEQARDYDLDRK